VTPVFPLFSWAHLAWSPVCSCQVPEQTINQHLDNACQDDQASSKVEPIKHSSSLSQRQRKHPHGNLAPIFGLTPKPATDPSDRKCFAPPVSETDFPSTSRKRKTEQLPLTQNMSTKKTKTGSPNLQLAAPLAERLRPSCLQEFVGQSHLLALMNNMLDMSSMGNMIFWGPPGSALLPN